MSNSFFIDEKMPYIETKYDKISNACYTKHYHDTVSIGVNEIGSTELTFKNKITILDEGSLLLINPFEVHCSNPINEQTRTYHTMFLDANWCYELQKNIFGNHLKEYLPFNQTILKNQELYLEYIRTNKFLLSNSFYFEKEERLINFLVKLFSKESCLYKINNEYKINKSIIKKVKDMIDMNVNHNITLLEIAEELDLSQFKIIRLFKSEIHLTPHAYLMNSKINKAKYLLKKRAPISDVYFQLGFFDQSHFIKNFKKIVAITPKQYQDKIFNVTF